MKSVLIMLFIACLTNGIQGSACRRKGNSTTTMATAEPNPTSSTSPGISTTTMTTAKPNPTTTMSPAVDGGWSNWSEYGECTKECGGGKQRRTRTCTNPVPQHGGLTCQQQMIGDPTEDKDCNSHACGIKPRQENIADLGYRPNCGAGWYDVQGQGVKNDYCRWVDNCGCRNSHGDCSFWSCALAGSDEQLSPKGKYTEPATELAITTTTLAITTTTPEITTTSSTIPDYLPKDGNWNLLFRQTINGKDELFKKNEWTRNKENVEAPNYSILGDFEKFRKPDGSFHLFLWYPELGNGNEWVQTSNPVTKTSGGVDNYKAILTPYTGAAWGGLEHNNGEALLDGSVNTASWWYAIGSTTLYGDGIPGPVDGKGHVVKKVELYIDFQGITYLGSSLPWVSCSAGWKECHFDEDEAGNDIEILGTTYKKGLFAHAASRIEFNLDAGFAKFHSCVGIDSHPNCAPSKAGSVRFRVTGDGNILRDWHERNGDQTALCFDVSVIGVKILTLESDDAGNGVGCDLSTWADAYVVKPIKHESVQWSEIQTKIWGDEQCKNIGGGNFGLEDCKKKCLETATCTAINIHKDSKRCVLRRCTQPVPPPQWQYGDYRGYYIMNQKECNNGGKLLSIAPDNNMALCKDIKSNTCEKDLYNLCPVGWHLCNPKEFNNRNDGWSYTTSALTFGQMYCRPNGGTSPFVITKQFNQDDPGNCGHYWSSRPGCDLWDGAQYGDAACNNKDAAALCCAPADKCGNGVVDSKEEECDDGNNDELDDCLNSCAWRTPSQHGLNYC